ncbi:hypothetical protein R1flu_013833 [Riccia fluitans]|uniref:Uncharacterized protein n=1 Tax=Riccia fluitans TaxID=41844 RepID=A0ABD1YEI6_9MARC
MEVQVSRKVLQSTITSQSEKPASCTTHLPTAHASELSDSDSLTHNQIEQTPTPIESAQAAAAAPSPSSGSRAKQKHATPRLAPLSSAPGAPPSANSPARSPGAASAPGRPSPPHQIVPRSPQTRPGMCNEHASLLIFIDPSNHRFI